MSQGIWVLLAVVVAATGVGGWRAVRDGRFSAAGERSREAGPDAGAPDGSVAVVDGLGERATLLQFSSAFCAPCRATRRVLAEVADVVPGVAHVELDAEHHLDLVRRLGILRTPTTLVLDRAGRELSRASGAPRKEEVLATLARVLEA